MDTQLSQIYNYLRLTDQIATAGQPTRGQFPAIAAAGFQTVINLALPTSDQALPDEREVVEGLGMRYIHIPVIWENPQAQDFKRFAEALAARLEANERIFVHCAANMRVSAFMALYRVVHLNWTPEAALQDTYRIWQLNFTWKTFFDSILNAQT